jgi:hypothetical protein
MTYSFVETFFHGGHIMLTARSMAGALAAALLAVPLSAAAASASQADTYQWSAQLVSADQAASTVTVKARVAYKDAVAALKQFKPGEKVWVVWSGIHDYSDAVRMLEPVPASGTIQKELVMPAQFVSAEAPDQAVTIRMKAPASGLAAIKDLKAGQWVTVTSRQRPTSDAAAVMMVKPYGATAG